MKNTLPLGFLLCSLTLAPAAHAGPIDPTTQAASIGGMSVHTSKGPMGATGEVLAYSESLNFAVNSAVSLTATVGVPPVPVIVAPPVASPRGFALLAPLLFVPTPGNVIMTSGKFGKFPGLTEDISSDSRC
jgi:hypothetical protein